MSPIPTPRRTWYKDGIIVYSNDIGTAPDPSDFFANEPILTPGVLSPITLIALLNGSLTYNTRVDNITEPQIVAMHYPEINNSAAAEELIFNLLLGNWTCVLQNDVGMASVQYLVQECGKPTALLLYTVHTCVIIKNLIMQMKN